MSKHLICLLRGHRHVPVARATAVSPDAYSLRCRRCGHERTVPPSGSALAAALGLGS